MYGEALAEVSVGYEYMTCNAIVWETQTARLYGFHMDISDIGGWNLDIHHMYNFEAGNKNWISKTAHNKLVIFCRL